MRYKDYEHLLQGKIEYNIKLHGQEMVIGNSYDMLVHFGSGSNGDDVLTVKSALLTSIKLLPCPTFIFIRPRYLLVGRVESHLASYEIAEIRETKEVMFELDDETREQNDKYLNPELEE